LGKRIAFCASPSEWSFVSVTKKTGQEEKIRLVLFRDPYDIIFEPFFDDLKRLAKFAV
jgi:hypothetical protein